MRDDWHDYFGDSTVYISGKHGLTVHLPDSGKPNEADRKPDGSEGKDSGGLGQDHAGYSDREEESEKMTHEEFKAICLREYPKIEGMVKMVKALNVERVSCDVYADGHINFDIREKDRSFHTSWHCASDKDGELQIVEYDKNRNAKWMPKCYYDHAIDDDGVEDDIPVQ